MKRVGASLRDKFSVVLVALLCGGLLGQPSTAEAEGFFTARRSLGLAFMGGSAVMCKVGLDYKNDADDFYDRYKRAADPIEVDRLYQRTNNRDIKSQVSWALAAAFAVSGVRLIFSSGPVKSYDRPATSEKRTKIGIRGVELDGQIDRGRFGLRLKKSFF